MFPFTAATINFAVFFNQILVKRTSLTIMRAAHAYFLKPLSTLALTLTNDR